MIKGEWPRNIFLVGKMCFGKDFIADELVLNGYSKLNFADSLKADIACKHGITRKELDSRKGEFREELQSHGKNMRAKDPLHWIKAWERDSRSLTTNIVCCDCRHVNETIFAIENGGWILRLGVRENVQVDRILKLYKYIDPKQQNDISETEVNACYFHSVIQGDLPKESIVKTVVDKYNEWLSLGKPVFRVVTSGEIHDTNRKPDS